MDELRRQQWLTQALGGRKGKVVCGKSSLVWLILPPSSSSAAADIGPEPKEGIHVMFVFHPKTPPKVSILTCHLISWKLYSCITMKKSARMKLYQDCTENHLVSFKYLFFFKYIYQSNIFCLVLTYWWLCFRNLWKKWICIATVLLSHPDFIGRAEQFSYGWPPNLIYLMGCNTQSNGSYEMFAYFQNLAILSGMRPSLLGRYPSFKENSKELQVKHVVVVILEHTKILLVL